MAKKRIPIAEAKRVCENQKVDQVIILAWDKDSGTTHIVTYGKTKADCKQAAQGGKKIASLLKLDQKATLP